MFTEDMIAPCGLDCSLCWKAHEKENPCGGCMGPDENKPDFCRSRCTIILCERLKREGYRFCDQCPEYPCEACREREERYGSQYALKESPEGNLAMIREKGMAYFLQRQREQWSCPDCGGPISVHYGVCRDCGREFGSR